MLTIKHKLLLLTVHMQEERCQFLQFTTGCACLPSAAMGQWEFRIQKGSDGQYMMHEPAATLAAIYITVADLGGVRGVHFLLAASNVFL